MSWAGGSTRAWRRVRRRVLDENTRTNGGRCTVRIAGVCTDIADTVHHVIGRAVTGDDPKHLTATCTACNLHIGQPGRHGRSPEPTPRSRW